MKNAYSAPGAAKYAGIVIVMGIVEKRPFYAWLAHQSTGGKNHLSADLIAPLADLPAELADQGLFLSAAAT